MVRSATSPKRKTLFVVMLVSRTNLAIGQQLLGASGEPGAELLVVSFWDLQGGWQLGHHAVGSADGHDGVDCPGFPGLDECGGCGAHGGGELGRHG